ncbi:MAG: 4-oxalocrotonate tautomerase [Elsteraceae bacterium]
MPLTLTITEGLLPKGQEKIAFARLSEAMLRAHGMAGNPVMTRNVVGSVQIQPAGTTFIGLQETPAAFVEWKTPSFAFVDPAAQQAYLREASDILVEMTGGRLARENIGVNVVHAVDGAWNFDGRRMTNAEIAAQLA